jgi:radical SAM superfamily enzyme YgiQ (UPF0313 family)
MHFTSNINRPPYEADAGYLQVTSGCSHASCAFCSYFKDTCFKKSSIEEIEADIKEMPGLFGKPKRIFLQSADGFAADYDVLMKTAELIHKQLPSVESIGGYARIDNFTSKTIEQLRNMQQAGFSNPYIGVESGDDVVLKMVNKGYTAAVAREQMEKLEIAGFSYNVNFLNGLGGHGYGLGHARKTAKLYDGLHPNMIDMSTLTIVPGTILYRKRAKGEYVEATEIEKIAETQEFLRCLTNHTIFMTEHVSVPYHVKVRLPEGKEELIKAIGKIAQEVGEKKLKNYREKVVQYF